MIWMSCQILDDVSFLHNISYSRCLLWTCCPEIETRFVSMSKSLCFFCCSSTTHSSNVKVFIALIFLCSRVWNAYLDWAELSADPREASSFKVLHSNQMRFVRRVHIHCTLPPTRERVSAKAFMQWCKQLNIIIKWRTYSCMQVLQELLDSYSNLQTHGKTQRKIIVFFWSAFILIKNLHSLWLGSVPKHYRNKIDTDLKLFSCSTFAGLPKHPTRSNRGKQ